MRRGFTLAELSIVLVIIGLLIGGIVAGKALMKSGEIKAIARQALAIQGSFTAFRDQYGYYPGDYPKAEALWGTDPNGCPNNAAAPVAQSTTCNGDGNGGLTMYETYHAWQHLANAGLIAGTYTGAKGAVGIAVPATKRSKVGIAVEYQAVGVTPGSPALSGNLMSIGSYYSTSPYWLASPGFTANEGYLLDVKYDDGIPNTGTIRPFGTHALNQYCSGVGDTSYALTDDETIDMTIFTGKGCSIMWKWDSA